MKDTIMGLVVDVDVLFVLHDAGETFAMLPVMEFLAANASLLSSSSPAMNLTYVALVMSTAQNLTVNRTDVITFEVLGLATDPVDPFHNASLSASDLRLLEQRVKPKLVITGMDSVFQQQISELYNNTSGVVVAGYLDGYAWDPSTILMSFLRPQSVQQVLVVANSIGESVQNVSDIPTTTVGDPSITTWFAAEKEVNKTLLRTLLVGSDPRPIVVFAGGYGIGYSDSVVLFVNSTVALELYEDFNFLLAVHPGQNGSLEQSIVEEFNATDYVRVLPSTFPYPLSSIASVTQQLTSQTSSAGVQCLYLGVPSIYLDSPSTPRYSNIAIQNGFSPQVSSSDSYAEALNQQSRDGFSFDPEKLEECCGIPLDPIPAVVKWILNNLPSAI
eukprot:TRINITY_DN5187_c0_g1_i2.p1 TRINITY_DN5187_c0_g1~~TRINITY_DN5187_c0_g1_i2.p1  ORF type:complete len:452 (-),score=79.06 TRINITY_DN5187_c0_g1_i2:1113-2273(-)